MPVFVTYARKDREVVLALTGDLERARNAVWLDNELTGGQAWWDTILAQIRACDLYLFALSPESLKSRACNLELQYALAVGRPLLPVMIADVHPSLAPAAIANTQLVDYRTRTIDTSIALVSAVANRQPAPALPDPLPPPPGPPMSYMSEFRELVEAPHLTFQQQSHLVVDLRGYLASDDDDRVTALQLLVALRRRRDIAEYIGHELDELLQRQPAVPPPSDFGPGAGPASAGTPAYVGPPQSQGTPAYYPPRAAGDQGWNGPQQFQQSVPQQQVPQNRPAFTTQQQVGPPHPGPLPPHPQATTILVLAILSFFCGGIPGIVSLVMGNRALKEIAASPGRYGTQNLKGARTIAIVGIIVAVVASILYGVLLANTPTT